LIPEDAQLSNINPLSIMHFDNIHDWIDEYVAGLTDLMDAYTTEHATSSDAGADGASVSPGG